MSEVRTVGRWLAMDIGCNECWEPCSIVGFYETEKEAWTAADLAEQRRRANGELRGHEFRVFDIDSRGEL